MSTERRAQRVQEDANILRERADSHLGEMGGYLASIDRVVDANPEAQSEPDAQVPGALLRVAAMRVNLAANHLGSRFDGDRYPYYHGDGPFDITAIRIALPDLIQTFGRMLSPEEKQQIIDELNNPKPTY
jgi:hypothetical protein